MRLGGKGLISDFLLVIVVKSVRGAFSGQISWHMVFLLNVTAQVSQCKKKKGGGGKMLSFRQENKTVQFCTEGKKTTL